jgi:AcrR family transcriptional regulator
MKAIEEPWLEEGYRFFANEGPSGLRIERMAKAVGKNKSSFYHLFADMEGYKEQLLAYHVQRSGAVANKEANATNERELIAVIIEHSIDLLFSRQLRVHRANPDFERCFNQVNELSIPAVLPVWQKIIGITENTALARTVLMLTLENFHLQITEENLNSTWLAAYFEGIRAMILQFR